MIIGIIAILLLTAIIILGFKILKNKERPGFYCQRDIEGETPCKEQCEHCKEYYKPIEDGNW